MMLESLITILILIAPPQEQNYDPIVDIAVENCKNVRPSKLEKARVIARKIYQIELQFNVPDKLKGMILAAACSESGFNPRAKGDHKFSKSGKKPMALGILQLWKYYENRYGIDRTDPVQSAQAWMNHIVKMLPKVKKQCKHKTKEKIWIAAWVTGIRYKKKNGRCNEKPKHLRMLKKIHKIYNRHNLML